MLSADLFLSSDRGALALARERAGRLCACLPGLQATLRPSPMGCDEPRLDYLSGSTPTRRRSACCLCVRPGIGRHVWPDYLAEHTHDFARFGMPALDRLFRIDKFVVDPDLKRPTAGGNESQFFDDVLIL